jgi:hypothetical protein
MTQSRLRLVREVLLISLLALRVVNEAIDLLNVVINYIYRGLKNAKMENAI